MRPIYVCGWIDFDRRIVRCCLLALLIGVPSGTGTTAAEMKNGIRSIAAPGEAGSLADSRIPVAAANEVLN